MNTSYSFDSFREKYRPSDDFENIDYYISYHKQDKISKNMEDIDSFIKRNKEEQEYKDFLEKNIYPTFMSNPYANPYRMHKFPELEPCKALEFEVENIETKENIDNNIKKTFCKLDDVENQIRNMIQRENDENENNRRQIENSCPICLEQFKPTSYFMPECGHKICLKCFTQNMITNKNTGGFCCLCRKKIIPTI